MSWQSLSKQAQWHNGHRIIRCYSGDEVCVQWIETLLEAKGTKPNSPWYHVSLHYYTFHRKTQTESHCRMRTARTATITSNNHGAEFLLTKLNMSLHRTCDILFSSHWHVFTSVQISCNILFNFTWKIPESFPLFMQFGDLFGTKYICEGL